MNIKDKLRELERHSMRNRVQPQLSEPVALPALLGGAELEGCFVVERRYPLMASHGSVRLQKLLHLSGATLAIIGKDSSLAQLDLSRTLFIDTETTGLSGGTGTLAFLVGIGSIIEQQFVTRQYFLRQPHEERAMTKLLELIFASCGGLISFNGKSFDLPLIQTRMLLNRCKPVPPTLPHLDVLHASRRIWKEQLQDCSLGNLESKILGLSRSDDVPGELIPSLYFEFVRTGNTNKLQEIFEHNRQDLLTTAALLVYMCELIESPFKRQATTYELRQIGKLYREAGELAASTTLFEELINHNSRDDFDDHLTLGLCYKTQRRHQEAAAIWRGMIDRFNFHPLPFIELAKHFEHRRRDYHAAEVLVQRALQSIETLHTLNGKSDFEIFRGDLEYRGARLKRKMQDVKEE